MTTFTCKRPTRALVTYTSVANQDIIIEIADQKFDFSQNFMEAMYNFPRPQGNQPFSLNIAAFHGEDKQTADIQELVRRDYEALFAVYVHPKENTGYILPAAYILLIPYSE